MRILVVSPYLPHAKVAHAGGQALRDHIQHLLERGVEVSVLAASEVTENQATLDLAVAHHAATYPAAPASGFGRARRRLRSAAAGLGPGLEMMQALTQTLSEMGHDHGSVDVVELHWPYLLPLSAAARHSFPQATIAGVEYDIATDVLLRRLRVGSARSRVIAATRYLGTRRVERRHVRDLDVVAVYSNHDARRLASWGTSGDPVVLVPRLVARQSTGIDKLVVFQGAMYRRENAAGVRWLLDNVWPAVRSAHPDAVLRVLGAEPPSWLLAEPGIEVAGWVDDLHGAVAEGLVFVSPLLEGSGLPFKVPQAMAAGLVVVSTPLGARGVDAPGDLVTVAATPEDFARRLTEALDDPTATRERGGRAREWALAEFDFEAAEDRLLARYELRER